jgi:hypothetical protein
LIFLFSFPLAFVTGEIVRVCENGKTAERSTRDADTVVR